MNKTPLVSCLCVTYGRPKLLEEAVQCFLEQRYDNKELIILNDQVGVELVLDYDYNNIEIINHPTRFNSLGEKRNYIRKFANGDYFCIWDDDDLYFPYRISESVKFMEENKDIDIVKPTYALMSTNNTNYSIVKNLFHSQACVRGSCMLNKDYPLISVGEDAKFEEGLKLQSIDIRPGFWYVYRWGNCGINGGIHHLSGIANEKESWEKSLNFIPYKGLQGKIIIRPSMHHDYWSEISKKFNNLVDIGIYI